MRVLKFGGTSVADASAIRSVISILAAVQTDENLMVVCSALAGVTNLLTEMSDLASKGKPEYLVAYHQFRDRHITVATDLLGIDNQVVKDLEDNHKVLKDLLRGIFLVREVSPRTLDYVLSFGERNSCYIIDKALSHAGFDSRYVDARDLIKTDKTFNAAIVNEEASFAAISNFFNNTDSRYNVVTGFIASDLGGITTTIGRGGSDYTASLIAAALDAEALDIFTDVSGVLTSDPRKVDTAFTIPTLSYAEAMEMSHFGAKVIYPPTILPALKSSVPIYIRNTFNPDIKGTCIGNDVDHYQQGPIKGISALGDISVVTVQGSGMMGIAGISDRLFGALAGAGINILLITQASSEYSITLAVNKSDNEATVKVVSNVYAREIANGRIRVITYQRPLSIIAVVGEQMKHVPGVAGRLFQALGQNGINIVAIAQGSSELNISFIVESADEVKALNLLHASFFDNVAKRFHLYVAGVGLIGSELIRQIDRQALTLRKEHGIDIRVVSVANSRTMYSDAGGIDLENYKSFLANSKVPSSAIALLDTVNKHNLPNSIFIDNTADSKLPEIYRFMLERNVSVVTPNKVAASGALEQYKALHRVAKEKGVDYLYETNVGAGLPIISTISNMVEAGDTITSIEAVLSGSLSYIFNSFKSGESFSALVDRAKKLGYTEPDPREDLSMTDVCRKIVILSRVAGFAIEMEDVYVEPFVPEHVMGQSSVVHFFEQLEKMDQTFNDWCQAAEGQGHRLRVVAKSNNAGASVGLHRVNDSSPFYNLDGTDNMVVLYTERYNDNPLVVKGPGAGAAVTAAGVFSDIISIAKRR